MSNYTRIGSFYPGPGHPFAADLQAKTNDYSRQKKGYYFVKRGIDIVASLLLVTAVLSWLVPVIALIIKFDSGGTVFFRQKRVGKCGRYFICYKFRTMRINMDADVKPAVKNDPRITWAGKWLR